MSKFQVTVKEARELCPRLWMREALDELVRLKRHLSSHHQQNQHKEEVNDPTSL